MGFVLRHMIDDIATSIKQMSDDKVIQRSQIAYWILLIGNTIRAQRIQKGIPSSASGAFLSTFTDIPVLQSKISVNRNVVAGRKYFELPETIYDFNDDRAIDYVSYVSDGSPTCPPEFTRVTFYRTTPGTSGNLYLSRYSTPSPKQPAFYRTGSQIVLLGLEKVNVDKLEIGLFTALDPLTKIDIDKYFDFPDELTSILRTQVIAMAKLSYLFPQERQNDGDDAIANKQVNTPKITSVNDQSAE